MGKRNRAKARETKLAAPTSDYTSPGGDVLTLRGAMTPKTRAEYAATLTGNVLSQEDAWHRAVEFLFERLAVRWEIAGLPLDDQKMLLGRYRMADAATQDWVRRTIAEHVERFIPELSG